MPAPPAEWWERWVARIIDGLIFYVVYWILSAILFSVFKPSVEDLLANPTGTIVLPGIIASVIAYGAYAAYDYVLHSKDGQTIGKKVMKTRLVPLGGGALDSSSLMKRSAFYPGIMVLTAIPIAGSLIAGIAVLVIGILIITDKPLHQGLHDKFAGTAVVKAPR